MNYTARIIAIAIALNGIVAAMTWTSLEKSRLKYEESITVAIQNLSKFVVSDMDAQYHDADLALQVVADEYERQTLTDRFSNPTMNALIKRQLQLHPALISIRITDRDGETILGYEGRSPPPSSNIAHRPYFIQLRQDTHPKLVISPPILGKISGKWGISFARRLNDRDGAFSGIIFAFLDVGAVQTKLAKLVLGGKFLISVRDHQSGLIAQFPDRQTGDTVGSISLSSGHPRTLVQNQKFITYSEQIDGVWRLFGYLQHEQYPFYVSVGMSKDDYLNRWYDEVKVTVSMFAAFTLTTCISAWLVVSTLRRRERTEQTLQQERMRLGEVIWSANVGTWEWQIPTGNVVLNARWAEIIGYSLEELSPISVVTWRKHIHPGDMGVVEGLLKRLHLRELEFFECEIRLRHKLGHWVWVLDRGRIVDWDTNGKPVRMVGTSQDITDRKNADERQVHVVLEAAPDGMLMVASDGTIRFANWIAMASFGYTLDELSTMNVDSLVPESVRNRHRCHREAYLKNPTARATTNNSGLNAIKKDGVEFPVEISWHQFVLNGESLVIASIKDISERKKIEEQLKASHDLLYELSEQVPGVFYQFKLSTNGIFSVPFASRGLIDMFGFQPGQLTKDATAMFEAVANEDRECFKSSIMKSAQTMQDWTNEFRVVLPDGVMRWREGHSHPVIQADGSTLWHGFVWDATERFEAASQLQAINDTLESRVRQRTHELNMALNTAEIAVRSRGEFLARMSHEIRTPLNSMLGMTYLALRSNFAPKDRGYLERIRDSGDHLLAIINDILDFSKIDVGKLVLEESNFGLDQMLQSVIQLNESKANDKGLTLMLDVDANVPRQLCGDALRLRQILVNFIGNAVKFTNHGGVTVRVHLQDEKFSDSVMNDTANYILRFEVHDTGIGLNDDQKSRLFQPFEQGDNSTTRKFGGTGLGLAISRELTQMMGGEVGVSSQPGIGSTFWFSAKLRYAPNLISQATQIDPNDRNALKGAHILVVDDNEFNLDVAKELLEDVGLQVTLASGGEQALECLRLHRFDWVLMDIHMPVMDGIEAVRRIRSNERTSDVCVIATTANAFVEDHEKYLHAGMNDVVTKPIDPDHLYATLLKWLHVSVDHDIAVAHAMLPVTHSPLPTPLLRVDFEAMALWDASTLSRTVGDNLVVQKRLLDKFLIGARTQVATIVQAVDAALWDSAADVSHKMKSAARTVGAVRLGAYCEAIEKAGKSADTSQCKSLADAMQNTFVQTNSAISKSLTS
jgi:PAS domain S-box-containing protein